MCLQQAMRGLATLSDCTDALYSAAGLALLLGILSLWWNPNLQETSRRKGVRTVGAAEFYRLQGMFLIVRCATWWYLPAYRLDLDITRAAHLSLLVMTAMVSIQLAPKNEASKLKLPR